MDTQQTPDLSFIKSSGKGGEGSILTFLALYGGQLVSAATGVPVIPAAMAVGGALAFLKNVGKRLLARRKARR